ncbi:hypothetical protein A6C57_00020 [Fibrella sp. ES10-3-2-2]|nr:hypothetical protein A6C57_00020 [Fibrella sp. ES10-3-2-2]
MDNPFQTLLEGQHNLETMLRHLLTQKKDDVKPAVEKPIGKQAAAEYLDISLSALDKNLASIPHHKPNRIVYFFLSELHQYVKEAGGVAGPAEAVKPIRRRRGKQRGMNQSVAD